MYYENIVGFAEYYIEHDDSKILFKNTWKMLNDDNLYC